MTAPQPVHAARRLLVRAIDERIFPAASVEVGDSRGVSWREAFGTLTFDEAAPAATDRTVFDLASLTKPIATTTVVLQLMADGALDLREPVAAFFPEWRGADREGVTAQDLLEHASGLAPRLIDPAPGGRREFEHEICTMPLEYVPRTQSMYSDLGFILLGFLAADRGRHTLPALFERCTAPAMAVVRPASGDARDHLLAFGVPDSHRAVTAPTWPLDQDARRGRMLVGEVHDDYAAALGGAAGHSGLFGTASGLGDFARAALRAARGDDAIPAPLSPALVARATTRSLVAASSRALGWDRMLPTSSCGARMSAEAFGHVGFTGTSLWIDPSRDRYFVLLTNRVCRGGTTAQMLAVRQAFHDALISR
jgi:CubicO group peptidase (beta-lactamase class C family)